MDIRDRLIPARDIDDEMDNQDDEDHEGFLIKRKEIIREKGNENSFTIKWFSNVFLIDSIGTFIKELFMNKLSSTKRKIKL